MLDMSADLGTPCVGLADQVRQSRTIMGVGRAGDPAVRVALFEAAHVVMTRVAKGSTLKTWAINVAKRRGAKGAKMALASKLGVILHQM
ncbi:transposase [Novosphingobium sediminicola]|uniref:Transposase n=1 Tax=Novosphingobium sediminicola TaxID=563162 RepID=A0A7W6CJM6_9SPHN|nr:transposase [Novosphingobium sediminicola]